MPLRPPGSGGGSSGGQRWNCRLASSEACSLSS
jgi:hypothetical protein